MLLIPFWKRKNACQQNSVPLITGMIRAKFFPPHFFAGDSLEFRLDEKNFVAMPRRR